MRGLQNLGTDYLYRALRTDEDPYKDIVSTAPNSKRCISEHVEDGLQFPSKYISTSASLPLAHRWRDTSYEKSLKKYKRGTTIVKIDISYIKREHSNLYNSAYNFTNRQNRDHYLNWPSSKYARAYKEVVFDRTIPSQAISDIYIEGKGWVGTQRPQNTPTRISAPTSSTRPESSMEILKTTPLPVPPSVYPISVATTPRCSIENLSSTTTHVTTPSVYPISVATTPRCSIENLSNTTTHVTTPSVYPISVATTPRCSIENLSNTTTHVTTPSVYPISVATTPECSTVTTTSINYITNDGTVCTETTYIPTSSPSHYDSPFGLSEDSDNYLSALETADTNDITTSSFDSAEKRSTGVKRSCEVDSEVKPAKYVCVDNIQVSNVSEIHTHFQRSESIIPEE